jgi:hypothetical protein
MTFMLSDIHKPFCTESSCAKCRYAECRYVECRYVECRYAECRSANTLAYSQLTAVKSFITLRPEVGLNSRGEWQR